MKAGPVTCDHYFRMYDPFYAVSCGLPMGHEGAHRFQWETGHEDDGTYKPGPEMDEKKREAAQPSGAPLVRECCRLWEGVGGPCPFHGGKWSDASSRCPECGKEMALGPGGKIRPHKPAGRNSPGWAGSYKLRPMTERFEFNKCPGAGTEPEHARAVREAARRA